LSKDTWAPLTTPVRWTVLGLVKVVVVIVSALLALKFFRSLR
jgi:hypothetical protein